MTQKLTAPFPALYDLFGEIPVTLSEVDDWMIEVPYYRTGQFRDYYIKHWRVVEKIQAKKTAAYATASKSMMKRC